MSYTWLRLLKQPFELCGPFWPEVINATPRVDEDSHGRGESSLRPGVGVIQSLQPPCRGTWLVNALRSWLLEVFISRGSELILVCPCICLRTSVLGNADRLSQTPPPPTCWWKKFSTRTLSNSVVQVQYGHCVAQIGCPSKGNADNL